MRHYNVYLAGAQENYFTHFEKSILHAHNFDIAENSFFELTINRNRRICENHLLVSDLTNFKNSRETLEKCGIKNYLEIIEPKMNCFTRAIAFASLSVDPEDILVIHSPNDYFLKEKQLNYERTIQEAKDIAKNGNFVIIGTPDLLSFSKYPYNYLQNETDFNALFFQDKATDDSHPSLKNTGIYVLKAGDFLEALKIIDPTMYNSSRKAIRKQEGSFLNEILCKEIPQKHLEFSFFNQISSKVVLETSFTCSEYIQFDSLNPQKPQLEKRRQKALL